MRALEHIGGKNDAARIAALEQQIAAYNKPVSYKPIYDLPKVYAILGYNASDVPACQGGNNAKDGKCKACVFMGFTQFLDYNSVKFQDMPANGRFDHNPWKCSMVVEAVKKKATEDPSITPEQVSSALTPLPAPPWK